MSFFAILLSIFLTLHLPWLRRWSPLRTARDRAAVAMSLFFLGAGALHFAMPPTYESMIPPWLPEPLFWVYLSGFLEVSLGGTLLIPAWRKFAGISLAILLLALLPANVHVAINQVAVEELPYPRWYFWLRIPFQSVYIVWALWAGGVFSPGGRQAMADLRTQSTRS